MKRIKIALLAKRRFPEFYDIRMYRKHASGQLIVRRYSVNGKKLVVDEEKSNE